MHTTKYSHAQKKVQQRAENADKDNDAAKLWKVVVDYDRLILERFTPQQSDELWQKEKEDVWNQMKGMVQYVIHKLGPEALDDFEVWYTRNQALQNWK